VNVMRSRAIEAIPVKTPSRGIEAIEFPEYKFEPKDFIIVYTDSLINQISMPSSGPVCINLKNIHLLSELEFLKYRKAHTHRISSKANPPHIHENVISDHHAHGELFIPESSRAHANNMNRYRSVCISGILWTLVFGGCVCYLTSIDYIRFEVGVPVLGGIIAILTGFLIGLWRNK